MSEVEKISAISTAELQPREAWTRVGGLNVRYQTAGSGPALVLLHGLLGYSFSWRHTIPILAKNAQIFAPDMPGAGLSDCGSGLDCRLSSAADRLLQFLDSIGVSSCDLIGSSYGGTTAMALAQVVPHRIRHLVLVSPANPWSKNGRRRLRFLRNTAVSWIFPKLARPMRFLHAYFVRRMYGDPRKVTPETLAGYARPLALHGRFEHAVRIVRSWDADMHDLRERILPGISEIPTLIIWGSKDRVVDPASAKQLASYFKEVKTEIISGSGHMPYEENPGAFARIVLDFLFPRLL